MLSAGRLVISDQLTWERGRIHASFRKGRAGLPRFQGFCNYLLVILLLVPAAACSGGRHSPFPDNNFEVTDHAGRTVGFSKIPGKIISLSPGTTEIIFALGLNARLVGVTSFCNYPADAKNIDHVGGYSDVDKEIVIDKIGGDRDGAVIFASTLHVIPGGVLSDLERLGYKVVVLEADTIDRIFDCMKLINRIGGGGSTADAVIQSLENRVNAVKSRINTDVPRVTVMHEVFGGHWIAGVNTLENDIITIAGGINIGAYRGAGYGQINIESIIDANPDKIVVVSQMGTMADGLVSSEITDTPVFRVLNAVKNRQIYVIDADIVSRSGPRAVDGLEEYARILHPDIFGSPIFLR
jgi:iron complex transport system substrate-binding protein